MNTKIVSRQCDQIGRFLSYSQQIFCQKWKILGSIFKTSQKGKTDVDAFRAPFAKFWATFFATSGHDNSVI